MTALLEIGDKNTMIRSWASVLSGFPGSSESDANAYCQSLYDAITLPGGSLYDPFHVVPKTSGAAPAASSSNGALLGLLALLAIPVIAAVAVAVWCAALTLVIVIILISCKDIFS